MGQMDHPDRERARLAGELHYFTGVPCENGHLNKRFVNGGSCIDCLRTNKKRHQKTEVYKASTKKYVAQYYLSKIILKNYGLTQDQYEQLLEEQNFKCKLCSNDLTTRKNTHIDHNHETRKVRGILCHSCNVGIGHLKHDSKLLRAAALYCEATND